MCVCEYVYVEIILVTNAAAAADDDDVVSTAITVLLPSNLMQKINSAKYERNQQTKKKKYSP